MRHFQGDTRLVLTADAASLSTLTELCPRVEQYGVHQNAYMGKDGVTVSSDVRLYDAFNLVWGCGVVNASFLPILLTELEKMQQLEPWDPAPVTQAMEAWLKKEKRMVELSTGEFLTRAFFVKVAVKDQVCDLLGRQVLVLEDVLCEGTKPNRRPLLGEA